MHTQAILEIMESLLEKEPGSLRMEQTLEELEVDSILFIRLVVQCETSLSMQFEDEQLLISRFPTVESFVTYVESRIAEDAADPGVT